MKPELNSNCASYDPTQHIAKPFLRKPAAPLSGTVSANERKLLGIVRAHSGISRSAITSLTEFTQQSVYRLIEGLIERGLLFYDDPVPGSGRGQPSPTVRLNPDYAFTLGISVKTDTIGTCVFDFAGNIRSTELIDNLGVEMSQSLLRIEASLNQQVSQNKLDPQRLFGTGFAIAGYLHESTTYNTPLPLQEWSLIELGPLISDLTNSPVWTENSANTAAVCEQMLGYGSDYSEFAYLSINYGFGGAAIIGGELMRGGHGNAGNISALYNVEEMEQRPALEFLLKNLQEDGIDVHSVEQIRHEFDPTWSSLEAWIDRVSPSFNRVLVILHAVLDPEAIVIGGQIPRQLLEKLLLKADFSQKQRHGRVMKTPKLLISNLDEEASSVGAAVLPFKMMY